MKINLNKNKSSQTETPQKNLSRFSIKPTTAAKIAGAVALTALAAGAAYAMLSKPTAPKQPMCMRNEAPLWYKRICPDAETFNYSLTYAENEIRQSLSWYEKSSDSGPLPGPCGQQEFFRFDTTNLKDRLLYLFSKNEISKPPTLIRLAKEYDVKIEEVHSLQEICRAVDQAAKQRLQGVIIHMDNDQNTLWFNEGAKDGRKITPADSLHCLSKIDPQGRIVLLGPSPKLYSTGGPNMIDGKEQPNIAQTIANQSDRIVIASSDLIAHDFIVWGEEMADLNGNIRTWGSVRPLMPLFTPAEDSSLPIVGLIVR